MATFGRNRKYAKSVKIYSFSAKTETEIRSNINPCSAIWPTNKDISSSDTDLLHRNSKLKKPRIFPLTPEVS